FVFINLDNFLAEVKGVSFHLHSYIKSHYCTLLIRETLYVYTGFYSAFIDAVAAKHLTKSLNTDCADLDTQQLTSYLMWLETASKN
ncbi:hypothetical protein NDI39_22020, partial [Microcoleus sp. ZQ-A2]